MQMRMPSSCLSIAATDAFGQTAAASVVGWSDARSAIERAMTIIPSHEAEP